MLISKTKISPTRPGRKAKFKALLVACFALALLLSACGSLTPTGQDNQILINEVFTGSATNTGGPQWVEIINNTNTDISLEGYRIETSYGPINLGEIMVASTPNRSATLTRGRVLVFANSPQDVANYIYNVETSSATTDAAKANVPRRNPLPETRVLGRLNPAGDLLVLKGRDGTVLDQVGWGQVDQAVRTRLGAASDANLSLPAPNGDNRSLGRTPYIGQREPTDPGEINPGGFTIHNTPSPGINSTPRSAASQTVFFTTFTDIIATVGAALLWFAFVIIALVARRFETLSEQKTYWQWLMAAPVGILIYAIIQVQDFIRFGRLTDFWSWPAFLALFVSGVACVYVINIFRLIAKNILEAE